MKFDTTTHDEGNEMLVADKRVSPSVVEALAQANITHFTPIQRETYDPLFDGRDMIGKYEGKEGGREGGKKTNECMYVFSPLLLPSLPPSFPPSLPPGRSRTGTGKTLAFGLPICEVVARNLEAAGRKNERGR